MRMEGRGKIFSIIIFGLLMTTHGATSPKSGNTADIVSTTAAALGVEQTTEAETNESTTSEMNVTTTVSQTITNAADVTTEEQTNETTLAPSTHAQPSPEPSSSAEPTPLPSTSAEPTPEPSTRAEPSPEPSTRAEPSPEPSSTTVSQPTSTTTPCNCPATGSPSSSGQESDFGRVGFVAFGLTFAIALILLVILIYILFRRKIKAGSYKTHEDTNTRRTDGSPMSMPFNSDGGLDNVQTIDLDKEERKVGNGTGFSSFSIKEEGKNISTFDSGATTKSPDSDSVNNLLHTEDQGNEDSDDDSVHESPALFTSLKVEPSAGESVESLEKLKETNRLMGDDKDDENRDDLSSIDGDLPAPSLSESENEDETTHV